MRVKLFTADHGFVVSGTLPPFDRAPDVLTWGERVFHLNGWYNLNEPDKMYVEYLEAFTVALIQVDPQ